LPGQVLDRLPVVIQLMNVEWITTHLSGLTPHKIAIRRFANPAFELSGYIADQLAKLQQRVDEVTAASI
jgi:hypothetical protein